MKRKVVCGVYLITNTIDGKVYVGQAKDVYRRISGHRSEERREEMGRRASPLLWEAYKQYGIDNFKFEVIEETEEGRLKEREDFWIVFYDSVNPELGYNLRRDTDEGMLTHEYTSKKISARLKKEWKEGLRDGHAEKLSKSWEKEGRRDAQGKLFSEILTKYNYHIFDLDGNFIESVLYKRLVELGLANCIATFHKKKVNKIKFKGYIIERI